MHKNVVLLYFQGNTFQLVLITDGVYSFVMYNYPSNGLQWSAPTQKYVNVNVTGS